MSKLQTWILVACAGLLTAGALIGGYCAYPHLTGMLDKLGDAAPATVQNEASVTQAADSLTAALQQATGTMATLQSTIAAAQPLIAKLGVTADHLNAGCIPAPCGTLADVNQTLHTIRGTFGQIEVAANHEDRNLTTLDGQELTLFNDFHGLAGTGTTTLSDLNASINTFNSRLASPDVTIMLSNGAQFTTTAVQLEQKLAACTLHPTLPCVLKSDILFGAQVGGYLLR